MPFEFVRYEKRDRIAYVTINRPEVMNALHPPANDELSRVWDDFASDADTWVAVVTGAGERAFSAGNDLKWTAQHGVPRMPKGGFGRIASRDDIWTPVGAAGNGGRSVPHRPRQRGRPGEGAPRRGGALGAGDPRVLAALGAGDEAGGAPGAREAGARRDDRPLPARAEALHERGRRRGTTRVRR